MWHQQSGSTTTTTRERAGVGAEGAGTGGAEGEVEGIAVAGATFTGYVISNFCPLLLLMESCKTLDELFMRNLFHNVASWTLSRLDSTRFDLIASSARKCWMPAPFGPYWITYFWFIDLANWHYNCRLSIVSLSRCLSAQSNLV